MSFKNLFAPAARNLPIFAGSLLLFSTLFCTVLGGPTRAGELASGLAQGLVQGSGNGLQGGDLKLKELIRVVLERNENIQAQMLGTEADRRKLCAELGIFEPNLVGNISRVSNTRQNTNQEVINQNGAPGFKERNNLYDTGIESLLPTGGKIRLGYSISDLGNTLTPIQNSNIFGGGIRSSGSFSNQWQTFIGATFNQPLLKNGGIDATFGKIRLAAIQSDIGFQQYRKQLMVTVSQAEAAYWGLYFAQEQLQFVNESLQVAESVLSDSKAKLQAGKGSELDILEAESGVALRRTKKNEALQRYYDSITQIYTLCGQAPEAPGSVKLKAVDYPDCKEVALSYPASCQTSFEFNPDYLIQRKHLDEETIRLGIARNQALPEVNARAAYGYNGLGNSPYDVVGNSSPQGSWDAVRSQNFPSWSIGLEVHIPLLGGVQGRNTLGAAKLTQKQAQVSLVGLGTQLTNSVSNSIQKNRTLLGTVRDYETVVRFREDLVKNELARLQAGKVEAYRVLEVEADLFEARQSLAEAQVQFQRSLLELQLAEGSVLQKRDLEITRKDLRQKTIAMLKAQAFATDPKPEASGKEVNPGK